MLTVCLDESGSFENFREVKNPVRFIGGVTYTGDDYENEKNNIEAFLKEQCRELGMNYPKEIHAREITSIYKKNALKSNLKKYLNSNGKYRAVLMIKSKSPRKDYSNISNMVDDDTASNLYEHMISQLINNIMFYNPYFSDERQINLEIATRSIPVPNNNITEIEKYEALGYNSTKLDRETRYYLTDQRTFKSAISTKMMESRIKKEVNVKLNVQSINYMSAGKDEKRKTTPFLYIADLVCDMIRDSIDSMANDFNLGKCYQEMKDVTLNDTFCWVYDDIDCMWTSLYENYSNGDYIGCLKMIFDMHEKKSFFRDYYSKHWVDVIDGKLYTIFDPDKADLYITEAEYLLSKGRKTREKHERDIPLGVFIGQRLWEDIKKFETQNPGCRIKSSLKYKLSDLMIMGYNHQGNIQKPKEYFKICSDLRGSVSPEDYFGTLLSTAQIYANEFDFHSALKLIEDNIKYLYSIKNVYQEISNGINTKNDKVRYGLLGKALSSLGQFSAFLGKNALQYFEKALEEFDNPSLNRSITVSYILHHALDMKDTDLYKKYEMEYFGSKDLRKQLEIIKDKKDSYMLYIYIKSLKVFYEYRVDRELVKNIQLQLSRYETLGFDVSSHPWELIYKYMAQLFYENRMFSQAKQVLEKINDIGKEDKDICTTINFINLNTRLQMLYNEKKEHQNDRSSGTKNFADINLKIIGIICEFKALLENHDGFKKYFESAFDSKDQEEIVNAIGKKFRYMYT